MNLLLLIVVILLLVGALPPVGVCASYGPSTALGTVLRVLLVLLLLGRL